jgi:hypothetical protein
VTALSEGARTAVAISLLFAIATVVWGAIRERRIYWGWWTALVTIFTVAVVAIEFVPETSGEIVIAVTVVLFVLPGVFERRAAAAWLKGHKEAVRRWLILAFLTHPADGRRYGMLHARAGNMIERGEAEQARSLLESAGPRGRSLLFSFDGNWEAIVALSAEHRGLEDERLRSLGQLGRYNEMLELWSDIGRRLPVTPLTVLRIASVCGSADLVETVGNALILDWELFYPIRAEALVRSGRLEEAEPILRRLEQEGDWISRRRALQIRTAVVTPFDPTQLSDKAKKAWAALCEPEADAFKYLG